MFEKVMEMYDEMQLGKNEICAGCRKRFALKNMRISYPFSPLHVGEEFAGDDTFRIMFVGKTIRGIGNGEELNGHGINDCRGRTDACYSVEPWPFWSYTRKIVNDLYGVGANEPEKGLSKIVITNIAKCSSTDGSDNTPVFMKNNCINQLGVIWREIELLKPKNVVFYTGRDFDRFMDYSPHHLRCETIRDKTYYLRSDKGNDGLWWWHRDFFDTNDNVVLRILRTGHPQGKPMLEYTKRVIRWVKGDTL